MAAPLNGHDIHISYCKSTLTVRSLSGRVTFYKDDFRKGLAAWSGSDPVGMTADTRRQAMLGYLLEHVRATANGSVAMRFTRIIKGEEGSSIWFEFSLESPVPLGRVAFENSVLFREYSDQINLVLVSTGSTEQSLELTPSEPRGVVTL
jgi:hypothetical protein